MSDLEALVTLRAAATPGPWQARPFTSGRHALGDVVVTNTPMGAPRWLYKAVTGTDADAAFIAAAGSFDFAALSARLARLEAVAEMVLGWQDFDSAIGIEALHEEVRAALADPVR
jgi:hypothetical protein